MDDSLLPELEYIGVLIESIESHWALLNTPYAPLGFAPARFYLPWLERHFVDGWLDDERFRQTLLASPNVAPPIADFVPVLRHLSRQPLPWGDVDQLARAGIRRQSARAALGLAEKACAGPLSEAESNGLGWHLTTLIALGADTVRAALREAAQKSGKKGGQHSAEVRSAEFDIAAAATCKAARNILRSQAQLPFAELVARLVESQGKTAPTIRKHLRTEGLYPAAKQGPRKAS